ncbi:MAG: hypothetical protein O2780_15715 [Proteobacteria bacterium]|nr:hypothetical protein [Pseudomonadota bacterium]MDA1302376.1 hypothetical protein [Pseudomonadota bacterium]
MKVVAAESDSIAPHRRARVPRATPASTGTAFFQGRHVLARRGVPLAAHGRPK